MDNPLRSRSINLPRLSAQRPAGEVERLLRAVDPTLADLPVPEELPAELVPVILEICRACSQSRSEAEWHRRAQEAATERETVLRRQLETLFEALRADTNPSEAALSEDSTPRAAAAPLVIRCLGPFRVWRDGRPVSQWSSLKAQAVFKYLVAHRHGAVSNDVLTDTFWPDADGDAGRRNLHQAIYSLRQTLKGEIFTLQPILYENERYCLNPEVAIWIDFLEFEKHTRIGKRMESAARPREAAAEFRLAEELYEGDFLEGDPYEEWASSRREGLRACYFDVADTLAAHLFAEHAYGEAIAVCQRMLDRDRCNEAAHRKLMQCFDRQGQRTLAVRQYRSCLETLKRELGVGPSPKTVAAYEELIREDHAPECPSIERHSSAG